MHLNWWEVNWFVVISTPATNKLWTWNLYRVVKIFNARLTRFIDSWASSVYVWILWMNNIRMQEHNYFATTKLPHPFLLPDLLLWYYLSKYCSSDFFTSIPPKNLSKRIVLIIQLYRHLLIYGMKIVWYCFSHSIYHIWHRSPGLLKITKTQKKTNLVIYSTCQQMVLVSTCCI